MEKRADERKVREGTVISERMDKTVVVAVERLVRHRRYKRVIRRTAKLMAHDQDNTCQVGDRVRIAECRPLSARKRWRVVEKLSQARRVE